MSPISRIQEADGKVLISMSMEKVSQEILCSTESLEGV